MTALSLTDILTELWIERSIQIDRDRKKRGSSSSFRITCVRQQGVWIEERHTREREGAVVGERQRREAKRREAERVAEETRLLQQRNVWSQWGRFRNLFFFQTQSSRKKSKPTLAPKVKRYKTKRNISQKEKKKEKEEEKEEKERERK